MTPGSWATPGSSNGRAVGAGWGALQAQKGPPGQAWFRTLPAPVFTVGRGWGLTGQLQVSCSWKRCLESAQETQTLICFGKASSSPPPFRLLDQKGLTPPLPSSHTTQLPPSLHASMNAEGRPATVCE